MDNRRLPFRFVLLVLLAAVLSCAQSLTSRILPTPEATATAALSPVKPARSLNQLQYRNLAAGELSAAGCAYRQEIQSLQE